MVINIIQITLVAQWISDVLTATNLALLLLEKLLIDLFAAVYL
ncbi:hypothetical protein [Shewanella aestuarii]|nr:hypothetical protein [Shewanella aestuarii]